MYSGVTIQKQHGAVLLVSLIILLIMTVIGTSGITSVTLEERMVSNMYDDNLSFQASESGLLDCDAYFGNQTAYTTDQQSLLNASGAALIWGPDQPIDNAAPPVDLPSPSSAWSGATGLDFWWQDPTFWIDNGTEYRTEGNVTAIDLSAQAQGKVATNPRCIREEVAFYSDDKERTKINKTGWFQYQNTAAATGADIRSMSVVQSAYFKRYK